MGEGSRALGGALIVVVVVGGGFCFRSRYYNQHVLKKYTPEDERLEPENMAPAKPITFSGSIRQSLGVVSFQTKFGLGFWKVYLDLPRKDDKGCSYITQDSNSTMTGRCWYGYKRRFAIW